MIPKHTLNHKDVPLLFTSAKHTDVECMTHIHIDMKIVLVTDGLLHMTISGKEYDIPKGYGVFISSFDGTAYQILEYVSSHFQEELTLESVAQAIGVHPVTISKSISKQTGYGFNYYLQYTRCSHAANLIKTKI